VNKKFIITESQLRNLIKKNIIFENKKNINLINKLFEKWKTENPDLTIEETEKIISSFDKIKTNLKPTQSQVFTFLNRYDGFHGYRSFNPSDIKSIEKYNLEEITFLLDQYIYTEPETTTTNDININLPPTEEVYEKSKELWFGDKNLMINEGNFRVYDIPDQLTSVKFGYYLEKINKLHPDANLPWCVTWGKHTKLTNMWGTYRQNGRSFYFIIDESKNEKTDKYFLGALQKVPSSDSPTGYRLTSLINDGDKIMSWEEITQIYPKLLEHKDLIISKDFTEDEMEVRNIVGLINERPGNRYEFKRQTRLHKKTFIEQNNTLTKPDSWISMDDKLRELYILTTNKNNARDKFGNYNFLSEVKKTGSQFNLLNKHLKDLGFENGIGDIFENLLKDHFLKIKINSQNNNIVILQNKNSKEFGIFNYSKGDWFNTDNIQYEPFYNGRKVQIYKYYQNDTDVTNYIVEEYTINNVIDDRTFYTIYIKDPSKSYFLSRKSWLRLLSDEGDKLNLENSDEPNPIKNRKLQNKPESDIKEFKRGY